MTPPRAAFYDFDGTLVASNVVSRYGWLARRHPSKPSAAWRYGKALLGVPLWLLLDLCSRRLFNVVFFRQYRGLEESWLREQAQALFQAEIRAKEFRFARELVARDKAGGYRTVLVSGGLDLELGPAADYFGFDDVLANRLVFREGRATGAIAPPLLAGLGKVAALRRFAAEREIALSACKAYSDSTSDIPMLLAVGHPAAANPDGKLRKVALARGWGILDLNQSASPLGPPRSPR